MTTLQVWNVDDLARRYSSVLLSRRLVRAFAAATLVASVVLIGVGIVMPLFLPTVEREPSESLLALAALFGILAIAIALFLGLTYLYVRLLSALATGARRPITIFLLVALATTLVMGWVDVVRATGADAVGPWSFLAFGALLIHILTGAAFVVGPMELRRASADVRTVLAEPRAMQGIRAETARLLHLPDLRAFARPGRWRAWAFVGLSLLLEGFAFYWLLEWPDQLHRAAERPLPPGLAGMGHLTIVAGGCALMIAGLLIAFVLIRLLLRLARACRLKARRLTLRTAADVLEGDTRAPVLFLRSFEAEQVPLKGARVRWFLRAFDPGSEHGTLEEMIVQNLTYIGPVVAIADPSRAETPVGAARWRLDHDEWQRFVEQQITAAGLIVIGLAQSAGLRWEVEAVRRIPGARDKAIFVCPPESSQSADVLTRIADALGCDRNVLASRMGKGHALIGAHPSKEGPIVFAASELTEMAYYVALRACLVQLRAASGVATEASTTTGESPGTTIPGSPAARTPRTTPCTSARRS